MQPLYRPRPVGSSNDSCKVYLSPSPGSFHSKISRIFLSLTFRTESQNACSQMKGLTLLFNPKASSLKQWISTMGNFVLLGNIQQYLKTFLIVITGRREYCPMPTSTRGYSKDTVKHPTMHGTASYNISYLAQNARMLLRLRNLVLELHKKTCK